MWDVKITDQSYRSFRELLSKNGNLKNWKQLTFENEVILSNLQLSQPESFYFSGWNNTNVQGWLFKPFGWNPSKSYPLAFLIHGGPQGSWNSDWSYRWNPQLFSSRGYVTVTVNPHGSTGFGQTFTDLVSGHWGGIPFHDLMKGVDYILNQYQWIDSDRTCALGASFGGYMINWINGQTNRFKCLVVHDGMFDTKTSYFGTEELWFPEWEFKGLPWKNPSLYDKWNPSNNVGKWETPTLVIHGGKDYRLPIENGISAFTALQRQSIPSKMLYFPEENHWVLRPKNSILWYDTVLSWLDQWTT